MKQISLSVLFLSQTLTLFAQIENSSIPSLSYERYEQGRDSIELTLEQYNEHLTRSGLPPIAATNPLVTERNTIWMYFELPLPEEGEDAVEIGLPLVETYDTWMNQSIELAPVVAGTTINGLDFDTDATLSGFYHIPPDPSGAVGTNHVCHVVNTSIQCHTKAGAVVAGFPQELEDFFSPLNPENDTFDPKILWDQYENRFVVVTLVKTTSPNVSRVLLAVSATTDPAGSWYYQAIDADLNIGGNDCWFDYPGFAVDEEAIYLTGNYFRFDNNGYCAAIVGIVDKGTSSGIYAGTTSADEDPTTNSDFNLYRPSAEAGVGNDLTMQPAHTYGITPAGTGTWLVSYSGLSNGIQDFLQIYQVESPLSTPTFLHQFISMGDVDDTASGLPEAPQLGNVATIATNSRRTLNAVWQSGKLWTCMTLVPGSGDNQNEATAFFAQLNDDGPSSATMGISGEIGGEDISSDAFTFFPSLAVNSSGNVGVAFAASGSSFYPGTYAVSVDGISGTQSGSTVVKEGIDDYVRTFGGSTNRWGDYGRMALDPVDDGFWAIHQAALANGTSFSGEDGRWGVFIQEMETFDAPLPVEWLSFDATLESSNDITLSWATTSEVNNMGFAIEQLDAEGRFREIGFVSGAGTTNVRQDYRYELIGQPVGEFHFRLRQTDYNLNYSYSPVRTIRIIPERMSWMPFQPNPFTEGGSVEVLLSQNEQIELQLLDLLGRPVQTLYSGILEKGVHRIAMPKSGGIPASLDLPKGIYWLRLQNGKETLTQKLIRQ